MYQDDKHPITSPKGGGVFTGLAERIKLVWRLLVDRRVNPLLKLLPVGSLVYLLVPDIAPGPVDDAAVIWLGAYLFVELCPPQVVQEHLNAIQQGASGAWSDKIEEGDIIDAEFHEEE
ncbi:MAG: hypothetical protein PHD58_00705 [Anaerolineales bacterium]|nr:hypothetical protein [Anaerolineales bacterium]